VGILDDSPDIARWTAASSDAVAVSIHSAEGVQGHRALRLDYDLAGTAGFALGRRSLPLDLPSRYEISFYVRADDEDVSDLQLKFVDASGDNVWWFNRRDVQFSREWRIVRVKSRQVEFAWGPTKDRRLRQAATIELVVAAGHGRGRGSVYVSRLELRALPEETVVSASPLVSASSSSPGTEPRFILDGSRATSWRSDPAGGKNQSVTIDFRGAREIGGLIVHWREGAHASRYEVDVSDDGVRWRTVARVNSGTGGPDGLLVPD